MSNPNREIDKTSLSIDNAEERGFLHRDYIAHCFRWSHVVKYLMQQHHYQQMPIMDIGCGKEMPLAKLLYSSRMTGSVYYGVDANNIELPDVLKVAVANRQIYVKLFSQTLFDELDFNKITPYPKVFVALEVIEHMAPRICVDFLTRLFNVMTHDAVAFISTPNFNGKAAANHINELPYELLYAIFDTIGFEVDGVWGTFASQTDIKQRLFDAYGLKFAYNQLAEYYDSNVLSIIFAPLLPAYSRNCFWQLSKPKEIKPATRNIMDVLVNHVPQHPDTKPYVGLAINV